MDAEDWSLDDIFEELFNRNEILQRYLVRIGSELIRLNKWCDELAEINKDNLQFVQMVYQKTINSRRSGSIEPIEVDDSGYWEKVMERLENTDVTALVPMIAPDRDVLFMWQHQEAGDLLQWFDRDNGIICGDMTPIPRVGDYICHISREKQAVEIFVLRRVSHCTLKPGLFLAEALCQRGMG